MTTSPPPALDAAAWRRLRAQARRLSRHPDDAEDLVQDALLVALARRRFEPAWLAGVMRRLAASSARAAGRRRRREALSAIPAGDDVRSAAGAADGARAEALLARLPRAQRQLAVLVAQGGGAPALRWLLGIGAAALRQRQCALRRTVAGWPPEDREAWAGLPEAVGRRRDPRLRTGPIRRALRAAQRAAPALGTHDPDGHPLLLGAHVPAPGGN